MKTVAIVIARMGSTRLPGKILMELGGSTTLEWVVDAACSARGVNAVWVATSDLPQDDVVAEWCYGASIGCHRGSESDVLSRFAGAARESQAGVVIRLTADCPFLDPHIISTIIRLRADTGADYACNIAPPTWPDGLDTEVFTASALYRAEQQAFRQSDRDCVTQYILRNRHLFRVENLTCPIPGLHKERWVLDTEDDLKLCREIADGVSGNSYLDVLDFLEKHPLLRTLNQHHPRNERFYAALTKEEPVKRSFAVSRKRLLRAEAHIPLGAQTFSKSYLQYPEEAPLFVTHGEGGRVFDVDGNEYVDLVGGLLPNILGYCDPDVDAAIRRQLDRGISFSLATTLESELAEKLTRIIPCAEMVRFGKNGTDVTSAAIRLARAYTGRDAILSAGYHGWNDWSVGADNLRRKGVPHAVANLTDVFSFDADWETTFNTHRRFFDRLADSRYAACIVEPETSTRTLATLADMCARTGTVLIFDEIITGFRWHLGGAQTHHGVTPDLATFGKAMANGMPLSAIVGRQEIMQLMQPPDNIFYSGTFFGEALSLAAGIATIKKLEQENVVEKLIERGRALNAKIAGLCGLYGTTDVGIIPGPLTRITFKDNDVAALYRQEMIANGVLVIASHNLCYAHSDADMERVVNAYARTFEVMEKAIKEGNIKSYIRGGREIPSFANVRAVG